MALSDQQILRDYTEHRSEAAFTELVRRHVDLVYSAALRMVCDAHLAEDVTQRAFVALAHSAEKLADRAVLAGWLHRTARNIAAETVRADVRRRAREQEAATMNDLLAAAPEPRWEELAPHLDAALDELSEPERDAVLLRYFEGRTAREMAQTLGIGEEAAQKRVGRAVERLRQLFAERGVTVGAGGLVLLLSTRAMQAAPAGLAGGAAATALATTAGGGSATAGLLKLITMTKLQTTVVGAVAAILLLAPLAIHQQQGLRRENESLRQRLARAEADAQELSNLVTQLKVTAAPSLPQPGGASKGTADEAPPFQRVTEFLESHREMPREQIEAYLQQNHRNLESLLAAFQVSRDNAYLREAATNSPNNPAVQFAVIANHVFPGEERKWLDAFKASAPDNSLPWYFSALDYFKAKQPDQAIQELTQAARRQLYGDYAARSIQAVEEMYESAGWPPLAAKAGAPGTATTSAPYVNVLKGLANETVQAQQQYLGQGDSPSANSMAAMGMQLGDQLRRGNSPIDELVGIAIEKKILARLDPAGSYDFLGRPVSELQSELDQQKEGLRETMQVRDQVRPTLPESELNNYWDREKIYGEVYAMQWLQSKHPQP